MPTPNTGIPYVPEGTQDPAAGLNLSLNVIDALLQTAVIDMDQTAPPGSPSDGDLHIVAAGATGAWSGKDDFLARYIDEGAFWQFYEAGVQVHIVLNKDDGGLYAWSGSAWVSATPSIAADAVSYDNTSSGLTASDVQAAIDELASATVSPNRFVSIALSDLTTDITTGTAKAVWFAPEDGDLVSVFIGLHDPSSSGAVTVDMNDAGGSVFTTAPSIDATEATSLTGTDAVLDGTVSFVRGDKFTFDIDAAGTDAKGLQVCVEYART